MKQNKGGHDNSDRKYRVLGERESGGRCREKVCAGRIGWSRDLCRERGLVSACDREHTGQGSGGLHRGGRPESRGGMSLGFVGFVSGNS